MKTRLSPMPVRAIYQGPAEGDNRFVVGKTYVLDVYTNPLSIVKLRPAIRVEMPLSESGLSYASRSYPTITDFFESWKLDYSHRLDIPVPFITKPHLSGDVLGAILQKFGIYPTKNCGCPDRKAWFNACLAFVPVFYKGDH